MVWREMKKKKQNAVATIDCGKWRKVFIPFFYDSMWQMLHAREN